MKIGPLYRWSESQFPVAADKMCSFTGMAGIVAAPGAENTNVVSYRPGARSLARIVTVAGSPENAEPAAGVTPVLSPTCSQDAAALTE